MSVTDDYEWKMAQVNNCFKSIHLHEKYLTAFFEKQGKEFQLGQKVFVLTDFPHLRRIIRKSKITGRKGGVYKLKDSGRYDSKSIFSSFEMATAAVQLRFARKVSEICSHYYDVQRDLVCKVNEK